MEIAPIALFVYKRSWHTKQTIKSLQKNEMVKVSNLFVFSDGPKSEIDKEKVLEVREYIKTISGFKSVNIVEREQNLGLGNSIITGVTEIINRYGRIIVLEDDMISSPYFLRFMNEALEFYADEEKVASIHGYIYPVKSQLPETFFLRGADCWGWATWKRGWNLFETDGSKLLYKLKENNLLRKFDLNGTYPYTRMLKDQAKGKNHSWAIRWHASLFLKEKLTLYPGMSLIHNNGNDESGTHCSATDIFNTTIAKKPIRIEHIPIVENESALKVFEDYFRTNKFSSVSLFGKIFGKVSKICKKTTIGQIIREITPPVIFKIYKNKTAKYGFFGNYSDWEAAKKASAGYDSEIILKKVTDALLKVKNGEASGERDSVLFDKVQYSWPLLAGLLWIASRNNNRLTLLDFGGSLGTSYFQNKLFLSHLSELKWCIVEQEHFVQVGKKFFENDNLKFYFDFNECVIKENPQAILLSSVLQYIPYPYALLETIIKNRFEHIIIDRTPFLQRGGDRITVQKVPPEIYDASYPAWFFNLTNFLNFFSEKYQLIVDFESADKSNIQFSSFMGFIFELKNR
ncbi:MAG: methyltransferase, TIGR04325 family [Crocinitomix sp.]|nr:methyltransferase, TIGR04325 family [Crocinitomix sp.]